MLIVSLVLLCAPGQVSSEEYDVVIRRGRVVDGTGAPWYVADIAIRGRWPDLTIILDMPTQKSMDRVLPKFSLFPDDPDAGVQKDRIERRPIEYHEKVRQNYLAQAKADPAGYRVVNADRSPELVHEDVWRVLEGLR